VGDDDVTVLMWRSENVEKYLSESLLYRRYRFLTYFKFIIFWKYFSIQFYSYNLYVLKLNNLKAISLSSFQYLTQSCPKGTVGVVYLLVSISPWALGMHISPLRLCRPVSEGYQDTLHKFGEGWLSQEESLGGTTTHTRAESSVTTYLQCQCTTCDTPHSTVHTDFSGEPYQRWFGDRPTTRSINLFSFSHACWLLP
jgi:hypothetical protein